MNKTPHATTGRSLGNYAINSPKLTKARQQNSPGMPAGLAETGALIGNATWSETKVLKTPGQTHTQTSTFSQPVMVSMTETVPRTAPLRRPLPTTPAAPAAHAGTSEPALADRPATAEAWLNSVQTRLVKLARKAEQPNGAWTLVRLFEDPAYQSQTNALLDTAVRHFKQAGRSRTDAPQGALSRHEQTGFIERRAGEASAALLRSTASHLRLLAPYAGFVPDQGRQSGAENAPGVDTAPATAVSVKEASRKKDPTGGVISTDGKARRTGRKRQRPAELNKQDSVTSEKLKRKKNAQTPAAVAREAEVPPSSGQASVDRVGTETGASSDLGLSSLTRVPKHLAPPLPWQKAVSPTAAALGEPSMDLQPSSPQQQALFVSPEKPWVPSSPRAKSFERERSKRLQGQGVIDTADGQEERAHAMAQTPYHNDSVTPAREQANRSLSGRKRKHGQEKSDTSEASGRQTKRARKNLDGGNEKTVQPSPFSGQRVHGTMKREKKND